MRKASEAKSGLKQLTKEADNLKLKVDAHVKECNKYLSAVSTTCSKVRGKELYISSVDLKRSISATAEAVRKLTRIDEQGTVPKDYEKRRDDEVERLRRLEQQVEAVEEKLRPDETEEDYLRKAKEEIGRRSPSEDTYYEESTDDETQEVVEEEEKNDDKQAANGSKDDSLDDEEGDDDYDYEREDGDDSAGPSSMDTTVNLQYEALFDYNPERKDELKLRAGAVVTLLHVRDDGWWVCEDSRGRQGLVPSTYMKEHDKYKSLRSADADSAPALSASHGTAAWTGIRQAVTETGATDVLHVWGAVPSGFRAPTLGNLHADGDTYRMENYLAPKLSASNLFYRDLFYDPTTEQIRPRAARAQKIVKLISCSQVPLPGEGTEVKSRLARVCLFNGTSVISNIHTVRAQTSDREGRTWSFGSRLQDVMHTLDHGELFVRSVDCARNVGVLIELSVVFVKIKTGQQIELACGWANLPLLNEDGTQVANKEHEVILNGGTPYEKGIEVDPTIGRRATSKFKMLLSRNRQPVITVRISNANREQKEQLDLLPEVLVSNVCYLHHISLYRAIMADALLGDKVEVTSTELAFNPFLVHFPSALEQPDLMDVLRSAWIEKLQTSRHLNKPSQYSHAVSNHDVNVMKSLLQQVFMEWIYPIMHLFAFPAYAPDDGSSEQSRQVMIDKSLQLISTKKSVLASLLSPDVTYEPLDVSELIYSVIGPHCLSIAAQS